MPERLALKSRAEAPDSGTYGVDLPEDFGKVTKPDLSGFLASVAEKEPRDMDGRTVAERFYGDRPSRRLTPLDITREPRAERPPVADIDTAAVTGIYESFAATTNVETPGAEQPSELSEATVELAAAEATSPRSEALAGQERDAKDDEFITWLKNMPPSVAEGQTVDTLHKIFTGETSFTQLAQEARSGRAPMFTDASTGEQLSLADVKAHMAAADTNPETIGAVADFAIEALPDGQAVTHEFGVDPEGNIHETQTVWLDDGLKLEAVISLDGTVKEVSVTIDAEPAEGEDMPEQHTVTVVEPTPEHAAIVAIDDEPVADPEHLATAAQVVEHAAELVSEKNQDTKLAVSPEQPGATSPEQVPEPASKLPELTEVRQQQLLRGAHNAIQAYVRNPETAAAMQALGVDFTTLSDKFRTGDVDLAGEGGRAFRELIAQVKPDSPLWSTKPGTNSELGRAADAQREKLANILKSL